MEQNKVHELGLRRSHELHGILSVAHTVYSRSQKFNRSLTETKNLVISSQTL